MLLVERVQTAVEDLRRFQDSVLAAVNPALRREVFETDERFIEPKSTELLNSWVNYDTAHTVAGYRKDRFGMVHLRGLVKGGTPSTASVIFTLPQGYRPKKKIQFVQISDNAGTLTLARLSIESDGDVIAEAGGGSWFNLNGTMFLAEQ